MQGQTRCRPARVVAPVPAAHAQLAGPYDQRVTGSHGAVLCGEGVLEVIDGDRITGVEAGDPPSHRQVDQDGAHHHPVAPVLDPVACGTVRGVFGRAVAVPHFAFAEDVGQGIPLGATLGAHDDHVVGEAETTDRTERGQDLVLSSGQVVSAGRGGDQLRVGAQPTWLWPGLIVGQGQRDDLAVADQRRGGAYLLGTDEVHRPELVVGTPSAPPAEAGDVVVENLGAGH